MSKVKASTQKKDKKSLHYIKELYKMVNNLIQIKIDKDHLNLL
jgi:hypothetical protein